jgi:signal transduction histidine kinase
MTDAIAPVATAIASAQEQLQTALAALATLPVVEADTLEVTRHALHNYLALTGMTLEVVLQDLGPAADPSILGWLRGLQHVTDLMTHTVRRLGATPALEPAHLACERVDLVAGVRRVCHFFDRQAQRKQLSIHLEARGDIPAVWTDRVAAAVVLTNLLSNALKYAPPGTAIHVTLEGDATHMHQANPGKRGTCGVICGLAHHEAILYDMSYVQHIPKQGAPHDETARA